jgi:hypothetical protein
VAVYENYSTNRQAGKTGGNNIVCSHQKPRLSRI